MKRKLIITIFILILVNVGFVNAQNKVHQAWVPENEKDGIVGLQFKVLYTIKYFEKEERLRFNMAYTRIIVDASRGYRYKGKIYGKEVPGLWEALNDVKVNTPTLNLEVYGYQRNFKKAETKMLSFTTEGASNIFSDELFVDDIFLKSEGYKDEYSIEVRKLESVQYGGKYTWATF